MFGFGRRHPDVGEWEDVGTAGILCDDAEMKMLGTEDSWDVEDVVHGWKTGDLKDEDEADDGMKMEEMKLWNGWQLGLDPCERWDV